MRHGRPGHAPLTVLATSLITCEGAVRSAADDSRLLIGSLLDNEHLLGREPSAAAPTTRLSRRRKRK